MEGNNLKRHFQVHKRFKETIDLNIKDNSAVGCNDILPAKDDMKYRGNTQEEDKEKYNCNNEDEQAGAAPGFGLKARGSEKGGERKKNYDFKASSS